MDLSALRRLIQEAMEDDHSEAGVIRLDVKQSEDVSLITGKWKTTPHVDVELAPWVEHAQTREPILARALEAALEVVEAAERVNLRRPEQTLAENADALQAALSRVRSAVEGDRPVVVETFEGDRVTIENEEAALHWDIAADNARLRSAIERALADSESGKGWGPDVTVCAYLRAALNAG